MSGPSRDRYLVCYDYGMGGLWWHVRAASADQVRAIAPMLTVFETEPEWMTPDQRALIAERGEQDIANPADSVLADIIAQRAE